MRIRGAFVVLVAAALAAVAVVAVVGTRAGADADRCTAFTDDARVRAALVTGAGAEVVVIGDSYSVGLGVRPEDSWPTRLPGRVRVDGFSGSGFSRGASPCGDLSYAARAPRAVRPETRLVVVQGGLNDTDQPAAAVREGFRRLMGELDGRHVVVVGPPSAPDRGARVAAVDALLARLCRQYGVRYLPTRHLRLPYLDDGLHLTPAGHRRFGDAVSRELTHLVARTDPVGGAS